MRYKSKKRRSRDLEKNLIRKCKFNENQVKSQVKVIAVGYFWWPKSKMQLHIYFPEPAALMSEPILSLYKSPLSGMVVISDGVLEYNR